MRRIEIDWVSAITWAFAIFRAAAILWLTWVIVQALHKNPHIAVDELVKTIYTAATDFGVRPER